MHKVSYSGEVVVCERWREEFGKEIDNPDQHFRLVYLTSHPGLDDAKIAADLNDARIAVMRPEALCADTREALADFATSYQEFDAAVRESYADKDAFAAAHAQYAKARTVRDRAFHVSQMADYLHKACAPDEAIAFERTNLLNMLGFESMLHDLSLIGAREENFTRWKTSYIHAYRKAHRAHYEAMADLAAKLETLRPKAGALTRMNGILELGPPLAATATVAADLAVLDAALWICPDAAEAAVAGKDALCPSCQWHPGMKLPAEPLSRLTRRSPACRLQASGFMERIAMSSTTEPLDMRVSWYTFV